MTEAKAASRVDAHRTKQGEEVSEVERMLIDAKVQVAHDAIVIDILRNKVIDSKHLPHFVARYCKNRLG